MLSGKIFAWHLVSAGAFDHSQDSSSVQAPIDPVPLPPFRPSPPRPPPLILPLLPSQTPSDKPLLPPCRGLTLNWESGNHGAIIPNLSFRRKLRRVPKIKCCCNLMKRHHCLSSILRPGLIGPKHAGGTPPRPFRPSIQLLRPLPCSTCHTHHPFRLTLPVPIPPPRRDLLSQHPRHPRIPLLPDPRMGSCYPDASSTSCPSESCEGQAKGD